MFTVLHIYFNVELVFKRIGKSFKIGNSFTKVGGYKGCLGPVVYKIVETSNACGYTDDDGDYTPHVSKGT